MEESALKPLDRGLLRLMRARGLIAGTLLVAAALAAEAMLRPDAVPPGLGLGPALCLFAYLALWSPPRRYRRWGYAVDGEALQLRHGLWVRIHTLVPLDRVQHIDVSQGPLERAFGICSLVLHTAGTLHSQILLPGLSRATAEAIRDGIRARIREEAG
ncbi:MAG: PH domain-containing protein [Allosphingosinicella sp.]